MTGTRLTKSLKPHALIHIIIDLYYLTIDQSPFLISSILKALKSKPK